MGKGGDGGGQNNIYKENENSQIEETRKILKMTGAGW